MASTCRGPRPGRRPPRPRPGTSPVFRGSPVFVSHAHGAPGAGRRVVRGVLERLLSVTSPAMRPRLTLLFPVFCFCTNPGPSNGHSALLAVQTLVHPSSNRTPRSRENIATAGHRGSGPQRGRADSPGQPLSADCGAACRPSRAVGVLGAWPPVRLKATPLTHLSKPSPGVRDAWAASPPGPCRPR